MNTNSNSLIACPAVPGHIRGLHVTYLRVARWYHLCCEDLGIRTIGQLLDAPPDDLRLLFIGKNDAAELSEAICALIARPPKPFDSRDENVDDATDQSSWPAVVGEIS
ncbi:hypothetical protein ACVCH0_00210 [Burkholderia glumae]